MGMANDFVDLLLYAKRAGIDFTSTVTLGHQTSYLQPSIGSARLRSLIDRHAPIWGQGYVDDLLIDGLAIKTLSSLDGSDYEGSSIVHDLNVPIPSTVDQTFDAVIDSGTLEHVFNFPQALKNCLQMVKVQGHFISFQVMNNQAGHGFYQFSPELFFRALSKENGFLIREMLLFTYRGADSALPRNYDWYRIADPNEIAERVGLYSSQAAGIFVCARRVSDVEPFESWPIQSDYANLWKEGNDRKAKPEKSSSYLKLAKKYAPGFVRNIYKNSRFVKAWRTNRRYSLGNRRFYQPVQISDEDLFQVP